MNKFFRSACLRELPHLWNMTKACWRELPSFRPIVPVERNLTGVICGVETSFTHVRQEGLKVSQQRQAIVDVVFPQVMKDKHTENNGSSEPAGHFV